MLNLNKTQKHAAIFIAAVSALVAVMALQTTNAQGSADAKTKAWYVANIKDAETKNKECRADSSNVELQNTPECVNALQALELRFGVKR
jgi:invasion protein IalB